MPGQSEREQEESRQFWSRDVLKIALDASDHLFCLCAKLTGAGAWRCPAGVLVSWCPEGVLQVSWCPGVLVSWRCPAGCLGYLGSLSLLLCQADWRWGLEVSCRCPGVLVSWGPEGVLQVSWCPGVLKVSCRCPGVLVSWCPGGVLQAASDISDHFRCFCAKLTGSGARKAELGPRCWVHIGTSSGNCWFSSPLSTIA